MGLLILTRREGESILVGEDIEFVVMGVKGKQVRIGVKAPKDVAVHRNEVAEKIAAEAMKVKPWAG